MGRCNIQRNVGRRERCCPTNISPSYLETISVLPTYLNESSSYQHLIFKSLLPTNVSPPKFHPPNYVFPSYQHLISTSLPNNNVPSSYQLVSPYLGARTTCPTTCPTHLIRPNRTRGESEKFRTRQVANGARANYL